MLHHLLRTYGPYIAGAVVVVNPEIEADVRARYHGHPKVMTAVQVHPTGMLDAILAAAPAVDALDADRVWITWCDQVAIQRTTVQRLATIEQDADPAIVLPTSHHAAPYIHFVRDSLGRIVGVLQRREGDDMPPAGESDAGLFSLSLRAFAALARFGETASAGEGTAERNFLPFIPWVAQTAPVITFPCSDPFESVGINTPEDLRAVERYLARQENA